jgi:hypothetical protein
MEIEEIKKELQNVADLTTYDFVSYGAFDKGGNYILDTYYTPLAESHRELLDVISGKIAHPNRVEEILSNAKKLINE